MNYLMFHHENITYGPCNVCTPGGTCISPSFHCRPHADAPVPSETAAYTIAYYNDMGHLNHHFTPEIDDKYTMTILHQTTYYTLKNIEQYTKIINNYIYTFFRLRNGAPTKENVVLKINDAWTTFCLDYASIEPAQDS